MHLEGRYVDEVKRILTFWAPGVSAFAFGSRVHGRGLKPVSDLDICLKGERALADDTLRRLRNAFEVSDIPFRIDLVDWNAISEDFRAAIQDHLEKIV